VLCGRKAAEFFLDLQKKFSQFQQFCSMNTGSKQKKPRFALRLVWVRCRGFSVTLAQALPWVGGDAHSRL
jgi:hypothetical protein